MTARNKIVMVAKNLLNFGLLSLQLLASLNLTIVYSSGALIGYCTLQWSSHWLLYLAVELSLATVPCFFLNCKFNTEQASSPDPELSSSLDVAASEYDSLAS